MLYMTRIQKERMDLIPENSVSYTQNLNTDSIDCYVEYGDSNVTVLSNYEG